MGMHIELIYVHLLYNNLYENYVYLPVKITKKLTKRRISTKGLHIMKKKKKHKK